MDEYLTILGSSALSAFRRQALARKFGAIDVGAQHVHYIALAGDGYRKVQDQDKEILRQLLDYGDPIEGLHDAAENGDSIATFFVSPRTGTISPWSSKATSIAWVCGLKDVVRRVERGTIINVVGAQNSSAGQIAPLLHDPMTEIISSSIPDLTAMFAQSPPASLKTIDMGDEKEDSRNALTMANKSLGLALDDAEKDYILAAYGPGGSLSRPLTDVELFMFAQVNSEHCRHKQVGIIRMLVFCSRILTQTLS